MGGKTCKQCPNAFASKSLRNSSCGPESIHSEACHEQRMLWQSWDGAQNLGSKFPPVFDKRSQQVSPGSAIGAERLLGAGQTSFQNYGAVVQGMSQRSRGMNPFQSVLL